MFPYFTLAFQFNKIVVFLLFINAVTSPSLSKLQMSGCRPPHHSPALFFFLVAAVVLLIFLILILVSWKFKNLAELKKLVTETKRLQGSKMDLV